MGAVLVAAVFSCVVALATATHDVVDHAGDNDAHACLVCSFSKVDGVASPILGEVLSPLTGRRPSPEAATAPPAAAPRITHLARGPPAGRV